MRRLTLLALFPLLALTADAASAQQLTFGARGGVAMATADVEGSFVDSNDVESISNLFFGILGTVDVSKNFGLQTEVWYTKKGFDEKGGPLKLRVNYVEIPVILVARIPGRISPRLYAGAVLGLESGCTVTTASASDRDCERVEDSPRTKGADTGLIFGGGVKGDVGLGSILLDVMYNYGLTNIAEFSPTVVTIKNRTLYLSAALVFPIGTSSE